MTTLRKGFRARRGRPRTKPPAIDKGTPELNAKRTAGCTDEVLDTLYKQHFISESELRLALNFRHLYILRFGHPTVQALDMQRIRHRSVTQAETSLWQQQKNEAYRTIADCLHKEKVLATLLRVAVFDDPSILRQSSAIRADFLRALRILATTHSDYIST